MKPFWSNPSLVGMLVVSISFLLLFFLPPLFSKRHFSFPVPEQASPKESHSQVMAIPLKILHGANQLKAYEVTKSKISLTDLLKAIDRPIVLNFWATWCPPCIEEFPSLDFLGRQLSKRKGKEPLLVALTVDEAESDVYKFFKTLSFVPSMVVLHDKDGEVSRDFGTVKFPETYLINQAGEVVHKWVGPQNWLSHSVIEQFSALQ